MSHEATSINGIQIRLPNERWDHITQRHADIADQKELLLQAIADPTRILAGHAGELIAIREIIPGKWLVVIYKEAQGDGFVITAYSTRRIKTLNQRQQLWP